MGQGKPCVNLRATEEDDGVDEDDDGEDEDEVTEAPMAAAAGDPGSANDAGSSSFVA